jgi:Flp pilus assembly protein TadD
MFEARRLSEAARVIDEALIALPEDPVLYLLKGQTEVQLGHLDLARASLERAAALNPGDPETRASLAQIRALTGR